MQHLYEAVDELSLTYHLGNTPFGIIVWDRAYQMRYCSQRAAEIFEWGDAAHLDPVLMDSFVHPDDQARVTEGIRQLMKGDALRNTITNRNITGSGRVVYCQWYNSTLRTDEGDVSSLLSLVLDVTAEKTLEQEMQRIQQETALIYNSAIDPMWLISVDGPDRFTFRSINKSFTNVTGLTPQQVIGKSIIEVLPQTSHALVTNKYNEAIRTGQIVDYVEEAVHPAGIRYGEIRVIPVRSEDGSITRLVGIANDITDRVLLSEKLDIERENRRRQITAAMIKSQENERARVGRELHDNVNQVLTTVKLYVELCADEKVNTREVLLKCSRLLVESINEIRSLSKQLSAPTLGNISFYDSLSELLISINETRKVEATIHYDMPDCSAMDPELHLTLYRILQEQLTNILKYAHAKTVRINLHVQRDVLTLRISDDGIGFDTTITSGGIGITNMRSRVELLKGSFELRSSLGEGTELLASFPVSISNGFCAPRL